MATTPESQRAGFRDSAAAERNFARVARLAPAAVLDALTPVLTDVADPDLALNQFVRLVEENPGVQRTLEQHPVLTYYSATLFGHSQWLGETLVQSADLLPAVMREKLLGRALGRDAFAERWARFAARANETNTAAGLARFKRREYVRIMLRDVLGIAWLGETTAELSALADVIIAEALRICDGALRNRYGPPQVVDPEGRLSEAPFAVLALGKLGGNEVNYSSDIDLLYIFGDGEAAPHATVGIREYFVRLAQELTAMLSHSTHEGAPYRIDLRLRPQGGEGELAIPLSRALDYYAHRAGDWELQALIKARYAAGDLRLAREFIAGVQPHVYAEALNFAAIETAVLSSDRIRSRRRATQRANHTIDVKLDRGGIRDIEFLVQCLQRVYGGRERWLRSGGTMFSLQKLHDKAHISGRDFHELTSAYEFLRTVEHRLQLRLGQQVHQLPSEPDRLLALARGLSPRYLPQPSVELLFQTLREHMAAVRVIYDRIIHQQQVVERAEHDPEFRLRVPPPLGREATEQEVLQRIASDAPRLYRHLRRELTPHTRTSVFRFLGAAFTSKSRYAALLENQEQFERALTILATSDFLTDLLVRHPEEIAALASVQETFSDGGERLIEFAPSAGERSEFVDFLWRLHITPEERLGIIRRQYRSRLFSSGARDVLHRRCVYDSLAETTAIAHECIAGALTLGSWPEGMAVFALGRLGTDEFDILSDADLVFVREARLGGTVASEAAVRLMQALSAYTKEGSLFPVDARLRPHGTAGELVVTAAELLRYFETEAQAWEALTWTKLRFICGAEHLCREVFAAAEALLRRYAGAPEFKAALLEMRERLEKSDEADSIRTGAGGLYDLDFIAGYGLVCRGAAPHRFGGNLKQRLGALCEDKAITPEDCSALVRAAELFRSVEHNIRLVTGVARKTLPQGGHAREAVEALSSQLTAHPSNGLEATIKAARAEVRAIFQRIFAV